ncbi:MAG: hypothetical protein Q9183_000610 [Haloplaca sp. 2 TL-2023]
MFTTSGNAHYSLPPRPQPVGSRKRKLPKNPTKRNPKAKVRAASVGSEVDQKELNAKAASAMRDLFPKISEVDIQRIIEQSFQKGQSKVGTAADQPFVKRVNLAVGAYIRHQYTDYDKLRKMHGYLHARALVQPITLDKIIEWRDEKDEPDAMEDILREVIVISDDEDEEISDDILTDREDSVEATSDQDITNTVHVQPLDYSTLANETRHRRSSSLEDEMAPSVKFLRRLTPSPPSITMRRQQRTNRQQAQRYRIYQEALDRRKHPDYATRGNLSSPVRPRATIEEFRSHPQDYHEPTHPRGTQAMDKPSSRMVGRNGIPSDLSHPVTFQYDGRVEGRTMQRNPQYSPVREPEHEVQLVDKRADRDRMVPHSVGGRAHPIVPTRSAYEEAERVIPSVEIDPRVSARPYGGRPSGSSTQAQGRSIGPRVVELNDDTIPYAAKRHRLLDANGFNGETMYAPVDNRQHSDSSPTSPKRLHKRDDGHANICVSGAIANKSSRYAPVPSRHMEWLPVPSRVDYPPKDSPAGRFSQRPVDGPIDLTGTRPSFPPSIREPQSLARPPLLDSQPRICMPMAPEPRPEWVASNRQPAFGRYESALPVRIQEAGPSSQYSRNHARGAILRESTQTAILEDRQMPVRSDALYSEGENPGYQDRKPHVQRPYEVRGGLQSSRGLLQSHEQPPIERRQAYHERAAGHRQSLGDATHLDLRDQTAYYYPQEPYRQVPNYSQASRRPITHGDAGVIYISSSPPAEAR